MADFVESIRNEWLDTFGATTRYLALFDGDPQGAGTELSGGAYARVAIASADWGAAAAGAKSNTTKKSFPQASADWNGGSAISHWALMSLSTGGVVQASDALNVAKIVQSGDTPEFDVGELDLTVA